MATSVSRDDGKPKGPRRAPQAPWTSDARRRAGEISQGPAASSSIGSVRCIYRSDYSSIEKLTHRCRKLTDYRRYLGQKQNASGR